MTSQSLPSLDVIKRFSRDVALADNNADSANWQWKDKTNWTVASDKWLDFRTKWYGATGSQCTSLFDPKSPSLSLEPLPPRYRDNSASSTIFVRESYVAMFGHIWVQAMASKGGNGVIITGQPGTGKSLFQYYLLVRLLLRKQVVLFSPDGKHLYLFYFDNVYHASMAALAAGEPEGQPLVPRHRLQIPLSGRCLMSKMQSALPDPVQYKNWDKRQSPLLTGLPLWSRNELAQGLPYQRQYDSMLEALRKVYGNSSQNPGDPLVIFPGARALLEELHADEETVSLSPEDALNHLLEAAIQHFGYSARDVFGGIFNYQATIQRHQDALGIKYSDFQDAVAALAKNRSTDHTISDRILALCPVYQGPFARVGWMVNFKSDWVTRSIVAELGQADEIAIRQRISFFRRIPQAKELAGRFLAPIVHRALTEKSIGGFWPLRNMVSNNADPPQFAVFRGDSSGTPAEPGFAKVQRETVKFQSLADLSTCLKNNTYYLPQDPNFPLFDAFVIDLDRSAKSAILWVLQLTTSRSHGASAIGYQKIRKIIAILKDKLGEGPPPKKSIKLDTAQAASTPLVEVRYLLVVPPDSSQNQEWSFPEGWNKNWEKNDHRGQVYCLEFPLLVW